MLRWLLHRGLFALAALGLTGLLDSCAVYPAYPGYGYYGPGYGYYGGYYPPVYGGGVVAYGGGWHGGGYGGRWRRGIG